MSDKQLDGVDAILAKSDDEIMDEELFQLFGRREGPFSREEMLKAMSVNFELGKGHILMLNEAQKATTPILDDTGLVERLRLAALAEHTMYGGEAGRLHNEAADRILALSADNARLREVLAELLKHAGIADAAPEDIDGEDHLRESRARQALSNPLEGDGK